MTDSKDVYTVTVYGSSSEAIHPDFATAAEEMGFLIANENWRQLNGGGKRGLMGSATDGGLRGDGEVHGVILDIFTAHSQHSGLHNCDITDTMTERKQGLFDPADAFVCLPGGLGTLEEISEVLSWRQLGFHTKPIVLLNTNDFYVHLEKFLSHAIDEKFVSEKFRNFYHICDTPQEAISYLRRMKVKLSELEHNKQGCSDEDAENAAADWNWHKDFTTDEAKN